MKQILRLQAVIFGAMAALYLAGYTVIGLTGGIHAIWALAVSAVVCAAIGGLSLVDMRRVTPPRQAEGNDDE